MPTALYHIYSIFSVQLFIYCIHCIPIYFYSNTFLFGNNTALIDTWRIVAPFSVRKLFIFRIEPCRNIFPDGTSHVDAETAAAKRNTFVQLRKKRLANRLKKTHNKTSKKKRKCYFQTNYLQQLGRF